MVLSIFRAAAKVNKHIEDTELMLNTLHIITAVQQYFATKAKKNRIEIQRKYGIQFPPSTFRSTRNSKKKKKELGTLISTFIALKVTSKSRKVKIFDPTIVKKTFHFPTSRLSRMAEIMKH